MSEAQPPAEEIQEANGQLLTAGDFLSGMFGRRFKIVDLPGGKKVRIRSLNEREKTAYEQTFYDTESRRMRPDGRIGLVCLCLVNDQDKQLFPDHTLVRTEFMDMDGAILNVLWDACWDHCGFTNAFEAFAENFVKADAGV